MYALRFHELGGLDKLQFEDDVPVPAPRDGEVQIKVAGAGINPVDWKVLLGPGAKMFPPTFPQIIAREFSGTVSELGANVEGLEVGDEVYGIAPFGTCAEYTIAPATATGLKPPSMDIVDAAAVPLAAMTAWQALLDKANLRPGQRVLIHAGAGGVGSFAVQIAKWKGAYVYATASKDNHHLLNELGADRPIDYNTEKFEEVAPDVDVVLETIGGDQMLRSLAALKRGGVIVSVVGPGPAEEAAAEEKRIVPMSMRPNREDLEELAALIQDLQIRPVIDTVVRYDEAIQGYEESMKGHNRGKVVIRVSG